MSLPFRQDDFRGGEVSKEFRGRTRDPHYGISLRTCKNLLPLSRAGLTTRPGSTVVFGDGTHLFPFTSPVRLHAFIFSDQSTAVLVFYNTKIAFIVGNRFVETAANSGTLYTIDTPYLTTDLPYLKFDQSGDVVNITCRTPSTQYEPIDLTRLSLRNWVFSASAFSPVAGFIAQTLAFAANGFGGDIATAYNGSHNYSTGDYVNDGTATYIAIAPSNAKAPSANPSFWAVAVDNAHMVKEEDFVVTVGYVDSFGIDREGFPTAPLGADMVSGEDRPVRFGWAAPANPGFPYKIKNYFIYGGRNGLFGYLDSVDGATLTYKWDGHEPDFSIQPPKGTNPFAIADGNNTAGSFLYPAVVRYHEQRRVYSAKVNHFIGSRESDFTNFDVNDVDSLDADSYDWQISSGLLQDIRSMVSQDRLVILTGQSIFTAEGPPGKAIGPNGVRVRKNNKHGASYLQPIEAEDTIIYNTAKGNHIRDLTYSFQVGKLVGVDLTRRARHLFKGFTITDWCYCEEPEPILWAVRSDGLLLSCTYDREESVIAWAQHPTNIGTIESNCSIPDGTEDVVYLARNYDGTNRYIERQASLNVTDNSLWMLLDAAMSFDGRNASGLTSKVFGGTTYAPLDAVSFTVPPGADLTLHVGDRLILDPSGLAGGPFPVTIQTLTSSSTGTGVLEAPLPVALQNVATTAWALGLLTQPGLTHLIGKTVNVLADGAVQGPFVVDGSGAVGPLSPPSAVLQIGIGYNADAELLDVAPDEVKSNEKAIAQAIFEVVSSTSLMAGEDFQHLRSAKIRKTSDGVGAPKPYTGPISVSTAASWGTGGRACVRQSDPLPLTISAVTRDTEIGGRT